MVEIMDLNFAYKNGAGRLKDVNLKLNEGEILTILGKNGAGKSTMLSLIVGAKRAISGEIFINGENLKNLNNRQKAKVMAFVAQNEICDYDYTGFEFIVMGRAAHLGIFSHPSDEDMQIADEFMNKLEISYLKDKFITQMSGGEKQMCMIARAMVAKPKIIIFDEPTSALDFANQYKFLKTIKRLKEQNYTIILTTHNPDFAVLLGGFVALVKSDYSVEFGKVDDIIRSENLSVLYGIDLSVEFIKQANRRCCLTKPL